MDFFKMWSSGIKSPFFTTTPVYLLSFMDKNGECGWLTEPCETGYGLVCFLSRIDAMIEGGRRALGDGKMYRMAPGTAVPPEEFRARDEHGTVNYQRGFAAVFHMGWAACDRLILRHSHVNDGSYRRCTQSSYLAATGPAAFEVSAEIFSSYGDFRERAGLFAWQETDEQLQRWEVPRLHKVVQRAIRSVKLSDNAAPQAQQLALFDPECQQWHFVPLTAR